jgi:uncharacterized protein YicC (UPF0701 family)
LRARVAGGRAVGDTARVGTRATRLWLRRAAIAAAAVACVAVAGSCAVKRPKQTAAMRAANTVTASTAEMRHWTNDLAIVVVTTVERAANLVRDETDDREVEELALIWKIRSVSTVQQAAFRSDPLIAFVDLWTLIEQQRQYVVRGEGRGRFGELEPFVIDTLDWLFDYASESYLRVSDGSEHERIKAQVIEWAAKYPIEAPLLRRQSMVSEVTDLLGLESSAGLGALGSLDERLEVLIERMPFYTEYLPKQAVWQAELALLQSSEGFREDTGLAQLQNLQALEGIRVELDRVADVTDRLNTIIEDQREAILAKVDDRLDELTEDADAMRIATVDEVEAMVDDELDEIEADTERIVREQRDLVMAEIERMRVATIEDIRAERAVILAEARLVAADTVAQAMTSAADIVDRAMWALTVRIAIVGAAAVVVVIYALRRLTPAPARARAQGQA